MLFGEAKYRPGFKHFNYVNPKAPKGGRVKLAYPASFDSLNPFIVKGLPAPGIMQTFQTLMTSSLDEPQSYYGLIAKDVVLSKDRQTMTFTINAKARWHDGTPITPDDVIFSLETLKTKGDPVYRLHYGPIEKAEKIDRHRVRFHLAESASRDLPFIVAGMPVISKAYYTEHDFEKSSLEPPLGSGPYRVKKMEPGRTITYELVEDYWGKDLPTQVGQNNYKQIRFDVYRDDTVALEALKSHEFDLHEEYIARNWATAYNIPAVERGELIKYMAPHTIPRGMQAFIFNLRQNKFKDPRVREAIALSMDFEWMNRTLFFDAYERNNSFFQNTPFAATKLPTKSELKLLEPYRDSLPPEIFTKIYMPPATDGSGNPREELLRAQTLLKDAGWELKDGIRTNTDTGEKLSITFLTRQKTFERVIAAMIRNLTRLGIEAKFRFVDDAQYQKRLETFDFDLISIWWNRGTIYPGNEQLNFWHSSQADIPGGQNMSGLKNEAVDAILDKLVNAHDLDTLSTAAHALDRTLLWHHLVIPHWHIRHFRVAFWDMFEMPDTRPTYGLGFETWWLKPEYREKP